MKKLGLLLLTLISFSSYAHTNTTIENYFVTLKAQNRDERSSIANLIHMDTFIDDRVYSVVNEHDFQQLKKVVPHLIIDSYKIPSIDQKLLSDEIEFPAGDEKFHTLLEVTNELKDLANKYPDLAEYVVLGKSVEGREIPGIHITLKSNRNSGFVVPGMLITGAHHAREHLSTEVPTMMVSYLLENYANDSRIKNLIDNRDIYIFPVINTDGKTYDIKGRRYKMWRKNRAENIDETFGVDLNRNYGFGWGTGGSSTSPSSDVYMGPNAFSEPETIAVKNFVENHANLRTLLSFHTFSELILYPWGGKYDGVGGKEEDVFKKMATTMAQWNKYTPQQASDLYIASGDTCDWAYGEHGIFCFTFELTPKNTFGGGGFYPGAKVIDSTFKANVEPVLYLLNHTADPYGVLN